MKLLETLIRVPYVISDTGFDISSDGRRIASSWNVNGIWEIPITEIIRYSSPQLIIRGLGGIFNPKWSSNGTILEYMLDLDGNESYQLHIFKMDTQIDRENKHKIPIPFHSHYDRLPDGELLVL